MRAGRPPGLARLNATPTGDGSTVVAEMERVVTSDIPAADRAVMPMSGRSAGMGTSGVSFTGTGQLRLPSSPDERLDVLLVRPPEVVDVGGVGPAPVHPQGGMRIHHRPLLGVGKPEDVAELVDRRPATQRHRVVPVPLGGAGVELHRRMARIAPRGQPYPARAGLVDDLHDHRTTAAGEPRLPGAHGVPDGFSVRKAPCRARVAGDGDRAAAGPGPR